MPVAPSVYSDDLISSTELNRTSGKILDLASERPVTITRGAEAFALMRRDLMAGYVATTTTYQKFSELLMACLTLMSGNEISGGHPYSWLNTFDGDELKELIQEILDWYQTHDGSEASLHNLECIIHEWHESAIAIASPDLQLAFEDEDQEAPLIDPSTLLDESELVA
jgi:hypothetical protein